MAVVQVLSFANTLWESQWSQCVCVCVLACLLLPGRNRCWLCSLPVLVPSTMCRMVFSGGSSLTVLQFLAHPTPAHHSYHPDSPSGRKHHVRATSLLFLLDVTHSYWHEHLMLWCIFLPLLSCPLYLLSGLQVVIQQLKSPAGFPLRRGKQEAEGLQGVCREKREPVSNTDDEFEQVLPAHHPALSPQGASPLTSADMWSWPQVFQATTATQWDIGSWKSGLNPTSLHWKPWCKLF